MFSGVKKTEVALDYRFFIGQPRGAWATWTLARVKQEIEKYGDMELLEEIEDRAERVAEKRFKALEWAGSVPKESYDWFLTVDSDTWVRFSALARCTAALSSEKHFHPQNHSVLIGRMASHLGYWQNTVPDNDTTLAVDQHFKGPWYSYPIGIGYMLSSYLTNTLLTADPLPAHHIHYPADDVMIGSWVAALKYFPDPSIPFEIQNGTEMKPGSEEIEEKWVKLVSKPMHPEPIDTLVIDEKEGSIWHDLSVNKTDYEDTFSWRSVAMHHVSPANMRRFRNLEEIKDEWE